MISLVTFLLDERKFALHLSAVESVVRAVEITPLPKVPDGVHMGMEANGRIILCECEPKNGLRPSVSYLFRSVVEAFGKNAINNRIGAGCCCE